MNKIRQFVTGIKTFIEEVRVELKKCSWPTRAELVESTVVVIISVLIVGVFVGASDLVLNGLLRMVIR
jgi:preprotein translocase subunit SecE